VFVVNSGLGCRQPGYGDPEGRAADIIQTQFLAELNG